MGSPRMTATPCTAWHSATICPAPSAATTPRCRPCRTWNRTNTGRTTTTRRTGRVGTAHRAPGPMFVGGVKVRGVYYGRPPSLTALDDGNLQYSTDFRRVYATVLEKWLGADSSTVLGGTFDTLPFI